MTSHAERIVRLSVRLPVWISVTLCGLAAAVLGWAYVHQPLLALLPAVLLASLPLLLSARVRFAVVVFGALFVFQSSEELTTTKLVYLFALAVAFGAALVRLPQLTATPAFSDLAPMLRASVVLFALVAISLPVSILSDVPQKDWLRDVAPYVMVASAPFFALDAQASISLAALRKMLIAGGILGTLGFTFQWLTNRDIADLGALSFGLPTLLLASIVFAYGVASLLHGHHRRLLWIAVVSFVFAMLLSTGTRLALILLAAPPAIVLGGQHLRTQRTVRLLVAAPFVALLVVVGAQSVLRVTNADERAFAGRTTLLFATGDAKVDQSYIERKRQTSASWEAFRSSPLVGSGPGKPIVWTTAFNEVRVSPSVDSPVSVLAKFGVLGLAATVFLILGFLSTLSAFRARTRLRTIPQLALIGFAAVVVAWSLLQNPYEDKGFAIGLMLLLALAAREASDATRSQASS